MKPTPEQVFASLNLVKAVADTIRDLKQVPSGLLYSELMAYMDLETYNKIIGILKSAGLVTEQNYLLTWVEPPKSESHPYPNGRY